ncbi:MAG: hypothetical protein IT442_05425 [Phycisphaeraceae bacterium]|nr:hypothetical protein [Phycisphaeraceae bacterium]
MAEIWEAVLGVRGLGLDDDFFELGGDSLLGVDVLLRVEQTFDLSLSPSSLIEHSSLRSFTAVVAAGSAPATRSPLVSVRAVGSRSPLFLVHPATGSPACFGLLARLLHPEQPVYAFRSPGLLGECWPLTSVPAMARRYVRELLAVAPRGPYLLGGASAGGLIAMEMARQLTQSGRDVTRVILIDTSYPPLRPRTGWRRVMDCLRDTVRLIRWGFWRAIGVAGRPGSLPGYRRFVSHLLHGAINAYRPGLYEGDLTLVVSSDQDPVRRERVMMMLDCCRQTRVVTIPGNHDDMFRQPIVRHVARELGAWLDGVSHGADVRQSGEAAGVGGGERG